MLEGELSELERPCPARDRLVHGVFLTPLQTFALLVQYATEIRQERGPIVRSVTMTRMIDRLGEPYLTTRGARRLLYRPLGTGARPENTAR